MKKYLSKTLVMLMTLLWTLAAPVLAWAAEHNIIILHTNDIHCGIRDNLGFGGLAQIKKDMLAQTPNVALVDAGDAIQGAPIGKLSEGLAVVNIMNAVGYVSAYPEIMNLTMECSASWSWRPCSTQAITAPTL